MTRGWKSVLPFFQEPTNAEEVDTQPSYTKPPFPRITYEEAMTRFGIDKPDMRIPFEVCSFQEPFCD